jgi:F0F1-type ATP synthase membrane subunit c/vacuolar-type H+-ATPase subunit K
MELEAAAAIGKFIGAGLAEAMGLFSLVIALLLIYAV